MQDARIVGIVLVRDEDVFVEASARNVATFCDELLLADHRSRDGTTAVLKGLADELPNARFHRLEDASESHDLIAGYCGSRTWVFGVDGDEIYDPGGLDAFRERLLAGEFDDYGMVKGIQLHCRRLDLEHETAEGWLAPPARSTTKLYNFDTIQSWEGASQRLIGGRMVVRRRVREDTAWVRDEAPWDRSSFRCLHVCFLRRSTRQAPSAVTRLSIADRRDLSRRARLASALRRRDPESRWKFAKYAQGEPTTVDVAGFFSPEERSRLAQLDVNVWSAEQRVGDGERIPELTAE